MAAAVVLIQFVLRSRNPPPKEEKEENNLVMPSHRFHAQEKNKPFRAPSL